MMSGSGSYNSLTLDGRLTLTAYMKQLTAAYDRRSSCQALAMSSMANCCAIDSIVKSVILISSCFSDATYLLVSAYANKSPDVAMYEAAPGAARL